MKHKIARNNKAILLDINFLSVNQYSLDNFLFAKRTLNEVTADQHLILVTDNSLGEAEGILESLGIKTGYLISNAGSIVKNIATQKILYSRTMDKETILQVAKACIWHNLNFSIKTKDELFPWNINYWLLRKYKSNLSYLYELKNRTLENIERLKEVIANKEIYNIEIYFLGNSAQKIADGMMSFLTKIGGLITINHSINNSILNIFSRSANKFQASQGILEKLNLNIGQDTLYLSIDQYTREIAEAFYLGLVNKEVMGHEDEINRSTLRSYGAKNEDWIKWLVDNVHLWKEHGDQKIHEYLSDHGAHITREEIRDMRDGGKRFLGLSYMTDNMGTANAREIPLWNEQIPWVLKLVEKA